MARRLILLEELSDASDSRYIRKQLVMAFQREIWEEKYPGNCLLVVEALAYFKEIQAHKTDKLERFRTLEAESYTYLSRKRWYLDRIRNMGRN
ncbi:hypothetical protein Tco_0056567 [Tanacetum coccineum]